MQKYDADYLDKDKLFDSYDIPDEGAPRQSADMFAGSGLAFVKGKNKTAGHVKTKHKSQDDLITLLVAEDHRGLLRVPYRSNECKRVMAEFEDFVSRRDKKLLELVTERTSDEDLQEKILEALKSLVRQ